MSSIPGEEEKENYGLNEHFQKGPEMEKKYLIKYETDLFCRACVGKRRRNS